MPAFLSKSTCMKDCLNATRTFESTKKNPKYVRMYKTPQNTYNEDPIYPDGRQFCFLALMMEMGDERVRRLHFPFSFFLLDWWWYSIGAAIAMTLQSTIRTTTRACVQYSHRMRVRVMKTRLRRHNPKLPSKVMNPLNRSMSPKSRSRHIKSLRWVLSQGLRYTNHFKHRSILPGLFLCPLGPFLSLRLESLCNKFSFLYIIQNHDRLLDHINSLVENGPLVLVPEAL